MSMLSAWGLLSASQGHQGATGADDLTQLPLLAQCGTFQVNSDAQVLNELADLLQQLCKLGLAPQSLALKLKP